MSNRLNKEREAQLQPERIRYAKMEIEATGCPIIYEDSTSIGFTFKGNTCVMYPYSGYFNGKGLKAGRGITNLVHQLLEIV